MVPQWLPIQLQRLHGALGQDLRQKSALPSEKYIATLTTEKLRPAPFFAFRTMSALKPNPRILAKERNPTFLR